MTGVETRSVSRNSLFLLANIRVEQEEETHRVKVRNLSNGGMMGEGRLRVQRGNRLHIQLRNIDGVHGTVAWVQDDRFGVAFDEEIDAAEARRPPDEVNEANSRMLERSWAHRAPEPPKTENFRKV